MNRAQKCGAGDSLAAVASLLAIYRSYTWTLADLLEQILTAAFTSIASCQSHEVGYWKAFVVGRVSVLVWNASLVIIFSCRSYHVFLWDLSKLLNLMVGCESNRSFITTKRTKHLSEYCYGSSPPCIIQ